MSQVVSEVDAADTASSDERAPARHAKGLTVGELARRYRVSEEKVRRWIKSGELTALNVADARSRKPRYVVTREALDRFERGRAAAQPKPTPRRRPEVRDYFPDD
jgi:excisionase family DNA binding protein